MTTEPKIFEDFTAHFPEKKAKVCKKEGDGGAGPPRPKGQELVIAKVLEEFPWLSREVIVEALTEEPEAPPEEPAEMPPLPPPAVAPQPIEGDMDVEEAVGDSMVQLAETRAAHADDEVEGEEMAEVHFHFRILGGNWTAEHKNVHADAAGCFARAHARHWCGLFQAPKQTTFYFSVYSEAGAVHLAKAWRRRLTYL